MGGEEEKVEKVDKPFTPQARLCLDDVSRDLHHGRAEVNMDPKDKPEQNPGYTEDSDADQSPLPNQNEPTDQNDERGQGDDEEIVTPRGSQTDSQ